jgi:L-threonylcarbamoyladenylate synthase
MEYLKLSKNSRDEVLQKVIDVLEIGGVVAFPTETFYGLGVKYDNEDALKRLYEIKKRPHDKAIPLIIGSIHEVYMVAAEVPELALKLMRKYWPGPLSIVLKAKDGLSEYITAGTGKVAVRVPGESFALDMVRRAGFPITATSANPSGSPPADTPQEVMKYFTEELDLIIDGGRTFGHEPSTIVEVVDNNIKLLRRGILKKISLEEEVE